MTVPRKKINFGDPNKVEPPAQKVASTHEALAAPVPGPAPRPSTRQDKKGVQLWLSKAAYRQLRLIAAREDLQIQDCMAEALDLFFESRGEHRIAKG